MDSFFYASKKGFPEESQWHQLKDLTIQKVDVFFIFTE